MKSKAMLALLFLVLLVSPMTVSALGYYHYYPRYYDYRAYDTGRYDYYSYDYYRYRRTYDPPPSYRYDYLRYPLWQEWRGLW